MKFAYLDESGDLGFKRLGRGRGTADFFVVALVLVDDPVPVAAAIDALKVSFGMRWGEEFRFSATARPRRIAFLEELRRHEIAIRAMVVNKALVLDRPETAARELFYRDVVRRAIVHHREAFDQTTLVIDEYIRGRHPQRAFAAMLRQATNIGGQRKLAEIKHRRSHRDNLIQAADMVAGAIYASRAHGKDEYLNVIQPRVREVWDWSGVDEDEMP